jgi:hypothetical protein
MWAPVGAAALLALGACSFNSSSGGAADRGDSDARPMGNSDGGLPVDGAPPTADASSLPEPPHLLLTEIKAVGGPTLEFIEIYNPGPGPIALAAYYLTDSDAYHQLPAAVAGTPVAQLDPVNDFIARFPDGASIPGGGVLVVAFNHAAFVNEYEVEPAHALIGGPSPMVFVLGAASAQLTDTGEGVTLFRWNGATDRVTDVDQVLFGKTPQADDRLPDKSGVLIDGPDPDQILSEYAAEAATIGPMRKDSKDDESYNRIALEGVMELRTGGNGIDGHDETSENTAVTWEDQEFSTPSPGEVPSALLVTP